MIFWGWNMRWSYDFDASTIYDMLHLKLNRLHTEFKDNGHCVWNGNIDHPDMKRIRVATELAKRLSTEGYTLRACREHEKKWGACEMTSRPVFIGKNVGYGKVLDFTYPNASTDKLREICNKDLLRIHKKYDRMQIEDRKYLFRLLDKYIKQWWD